MVSSQRSSEVFTVNVFKVSLGSFDTHSKQHNTHNRLLSELSQSIKKTTNIIITYFSKIIIKGDNFSFCVGISYTI